MSVTPFSPLNGSARSEGRALAELIGSIAPFRGLPDAVCDALCANAGRRRYDAGQTVYSVGQYDGGEFFVVVSGVLKVATIDSASGAMVIEEYGEKSVFALDLAMSGCDEELYHRMSVTAEKALDLVAIDTHSFRELASQRPSLMRNLAAVFAEELALQRFSASAPGAAPAQRVFAALLSYVERDEVRGVWRIAKMPKHRQLAEAAGVDEAIAANAVALLIRESIAFREYPGLIIDDMARLNQLAH